MKSCPQCRRSYPGSFFVCPADGTPLLRQDEWSPGTLIRGKYRIVEKLGQGAMGAVYKAMHVRFNEPRALKVMAPALASDKAFVKRFEQEGILARKLRHPNAVHVEDIDETDDGQPFIVMEYIAGRSLAKLLKSEGALPVARVIPLVKQIAAALETAHRLGVIHRDIKPDNIVLVTSPSGETAKVLDFGIAKMKEGLDESSDFSLTYTGMVVGTPFYMSPEQAKGVPGDRLDGRSDLYSLGIVMYQMLTGELPFKGTTRIEVLMAHIETPPPPISRVRPDLHIPDAMSQFVMRCLAKDPQHRPQTGGELIAELGAWESNRTKLYSESGLSAERPGHATQQTRANEVSDSVVTATPPPFPGAPTGEASSVQPPSRPAGSPHSDSIFASPIELPSSAQSTLRGKESPQPSSARKFIWATLAALVVIIGGALWYSGTSRSPAPIRTQSAEPSSTSPASGNSATNPQNQFQPSTPANSAEAWLETLGAGATSAAAPRPSHPSKTSAKSSSQPPPEAAVDPGTRTKKVTAALTLGDWFYKKGEYDNAVKEYQQGLQVDPSSEELKNRIRRARAKATKQSISP